MRDGIKKLRQSKAWRSLQSDGSSRTAARFDYAKFAFANTGWHPIFTHESTFGAQSLYLVSHGGGGHFGGHLGGFGGAFTFTTLQFQTAIADAPHWLALPLATH